VLESTMDWALAASESAGTLPLLDWEALDSGLRTSSLVMWKVLSDMLVVYVGGG
jgi:hypothetical protein